MKKIKSVFERDYEGTHLVYDSVVPGCEWVLAGEGVATRKYDGSCCAIIDGELFRRHDCKKGKKPPEGFVPAQDPDPITGHWPGWIKCDRENPQDKWFVAAYENSWLHQKDGTYEAIGPHFQGNAEKLQEDILVRHGDEILENVPRTFEGIREYLKENDIEGIVFHRQNAENDMAKIKRVDFGFEWNGKIKKR